MHTLSQYTIDGSGAYVTTGAGAMVDTPDQTSTERMRAKKRGEDWSGPAHGRGSAAGSGLKGSSGGPPPPPPDDDHKPSDDNGGSDDGGGDLERRSRRHCSDARGGSRAVQRPGSKSAGGMQALVL